MYIRHKYISRCIAKGNDGYYETDGISLRAVAFSIVSVKAASFQENRVVACVIEREKNEVY
jgi:hypothetical protein